MHRLVMILAVGLSISGANGADWSELKVKREAVFEFAQKPIVTRAGDAVTVTFESKGFCDATVAIENAEGRIIRHLASGVLGPKAPEPFQKDSKKQSIVWDGKSDQGTYVDDKDSHAVRVSLGLKPQFERTLYWSPHKRVSVEPPAIAATADGVYVAEGRGVDHVRLYDHEGNYLRTVYPFPANKLGQVEKLPWQNVPPDDLRAPVRQGFYLSTLLTCGRNASTNRQLSQSDPPQGQIGMGATAMAARGKQIALACLKVDRLAGDGSSDGLPVEGPDCFVRMPKQFYQAASDSGPHSAAFSPDGKWLYLTGYHPPDQDPGVASRPFQLDWLHGVLRMEYGRNDPPHVFVGSDKPGRESAGTDKNKLKVPTSVTCDRKGRVYVSDYMNDRIQVFDSDGGHLKTIPALKPAQVCVNQLTDEIYVFSWAISSQNITQAMGDAKTMVEATLTVFGSFDDSLERARYPLPMPKGKLLTGASGVEYRVELDSWAKPPVIWFVPGPLSWYDASGGSHDTFERGQIELLAVENGKLVVKRNFAKDVRSAVTRLEPIAGGTRQRIYVNHGTGELFVGEGGYQNLQLVNIDPASGKIRQVELPFDCADLAFDLEGYAYLRTDREVVRYNPADWHEVPFDYGEEKRGVGFFRPKKTGSVRSAMIVGNGGTIHFDGLSIVPDGTMVVQITSGVAKSLKRDATEQTLATGKVYTPKVYPGRVMGGEESIIHVFDKHGKMVYEDAIPGLNRIHGAWMDRQGALYVMSAGTRNFDGKPSVHGSTGTLMKFKPGAARILADGKEPLIPLSEEGKPHRPADLLYGASLWVENAEWFYGGVGYDWRKNNLCNCVNSSAAFDFFGRSFAPELARCSVAVVDSNGNLITRIGQYGNVDDGVPFISAGGPAQPRSIGGDEVGLFYGLYVATHTDRRLFVADPGNARIVSVKLNYHAEEKLALKDVKDQATK